MFDIDWIMEQVRAETRKEAESAGQMTLGGFIDALAAMPPEAVVRFGSGLSPCDPDSYRGYYEQLAFDSCSSPRTVAQVLTDARDALGETFEGYKGGKYLMGKQTMIWSASYGHCGDRIVGLSLSGDGVVVHTAPDED